jgi:hypothetical protein
LARLKACGDLCMTQARRREFDRDFLIVRQPAGRMAVATGDEIPVASPALELQRALDEMFTSTPIRRLDYRRGVVLTAGTLAIVAACCAFWWQALHWLTTSLV